jgi:hypothetical protein
MVFLGGESTFILSSKEELGVVERVKMSSSSFFVCSGAGGDQLE